MDKERLKNTILAVAHQILCTCSQEKLENALAAFLMGDPVTLKPHKPIILEDYDTLVAKLNRALKYRPRRIYKSMPPLPQTEMADDLFSVMVPMTLDVSKLSNKERQILCQNMDDTLIMTCHPPFVRNKKIVQCRAKIGVRISRMWDEWKNFAHDKIEFIKKETNDFFKSHVGAAVMIFSPRFVHRFYKYQMTEEQFYFGIPP